MILSFQVYQFAESLVRDVFRLFSNRIHPINNINKIIKFSKPSNNWFSGALIMNLKEF